MQEPACTAHHAGYMQICNFWIKQFNGECNFSSLQGNKQSSGWLNNPGRPCWDTLQDFATAVLNLSSEDNIKLHSLPDVELKGRTYSVSSYPVANTEKQNGVFQRDFSKAVYKVWLFLFVLTFHNSHQFSQDTSFTLYDILAKKGGGQSCLS